MKSSMRNTRVKKNLRVRFLLDASTDKSMHGGVSDEPCIAAHAANQSSISRGGGHGHGYGWSSSKPSSVSHSPYSYSSPQGRCYICDNYKHYYHNRNSSAGSLNSSSSGSSYSAGSLSMPPYYDYYNSIVSNLVPQMQMYYY
ncbi:hypothetical protein E3P99_02335 [Wallemia hederae]|uniref:Uncharacterized protein n=1 Tax=Wallemia hederae TaxID=1540922 RepID=A0A4T0FLE3_9BASI|nr:hypothetical protein E3P99_02335 [Wallemia hederae]